MKTKEEIDDLYYKYWDDFNDKYDDNLHYYSFVEGYNQCQEDMADKKYTEEDLKKAFKFYAYAHISQQPHSYEKLEQDYLQFINSLNKQE